MTVNRRTFLQQMGGILAALGLSETALGIMGDRYLQAIAQPSRRKLALLIGINDYPQSVCDYVPLHSALNGCLTDVELQGELLQYRFGFQPSDIVTLTDQQATRQNITDAFAEHLTAQAKAGDVAVFHFSGLGSLVEHPGGFSQSLVPIDGTLPTPESPAQDLWLETLESWVRSLATDQTIVILDSGHTQLGNPFQGNLQVRSRPHAIKDAALKQTQRLSSRSMILTAAAPEQAVMEGQWNGFSAGLFTSALTQQLWWNTSPLTISFNGAIATLRQSTAALQQPVMNGKNSQLKAVNPPADGVVTQVGEEGQVQLWLGGLPPIVLEHYAASILKNSGAQTVQILSREGIYAKAKALDPVQIGDAIQESIRVLPRNVNLTVALDKSLNRIERVDATSAFAGIPRIASVKAGEPADILFGKSDDTSVGYSLFYLNKAATALPSNANSIPSEESIKKSVSRLKPQLQTLLATHLLRLTANRGTSRLGIRATLEMVAPQAKTILQQETVRSPFTPPNPSPALIDQPLPLNSQIRYQLCNFGDTPLYYMVLGLDTSGEAIALNLSADESLIPAQETLTIPNPTIDWKVQAPAGLAETYLIFSPKPLTQSYTVLASVVSSPPNQRLTRVERLLDVVEAVLQELQETEISADTYALAVDRWATLSFVYAVTA
jgi:hypothetical protein